MPDWSWTKRLDVKQRDNIKLVCKQCESVQIIILREHIPSSQGMAGEGMIPEKTNILAECTNCGATEKLFDGWWH